MDYDQTTMPELYDKGREYLPVTRAQWVKKISRSVQNHDINTAVDLGCGTGRYSTILSEALDAKIFGIDPSHKMLALAKQKLPTHITLLSGEAESIPIGDASVDLVFISMVLHHIGDRKRAAAECRRILRTSGLIMLRAVTCEQIPNYPYVPFFPSCTPKMEDRFLTINDTIKLFENTGLKLVSHEVITNIIAENWLTFTERTALRADSVLQMLDDREFNNGIAALRQHATEVQGEAKVSEPIDFFVFANAS